MFTKVASSFLAFVLVFNIFMFSPTLAKEFVVGSSEVFQGDFEEDFQFFDEYENELELGLELADYAVENYEELDESEIRELTNGLQEMSDDEFDSFMHNFIALNDAVSTEDKIEIMGHFNVEVNIQEDEEDNFFARTAIKNLHLKNYSAKRGSDTFWRLFVSWDVQQSEKNPSTLDLVSIEWDSSIAGYWDSNIGDSKIVSKRSGSQRSNGIYLFNVDDSRGIYSSYAVVYVNKKKTGWLDYGSKYTHTYTTSSTTNSGNTSFSFDTSGKAAFGVSYTTTVQSKESFWEKWSDNAVWL